MTCVVTNVVRCGAAGAYVCFFISCGFPAENKIPAAKAGALEALVAVARQHVTHAGVAEQAAGALAYISVASGACNTLFSHCLLYVLLSLLAQPA
jgi:hypothetical protein